MSNFLNCTGAGPKTSLQLLCLLAVTRSLCGSMLYLYPVHFISHDQMLTSGPYGSVLLRSV